MLQQPAGETLPGMFLIARPLCFLLENLILALAASKTDIFLMGCEKLPLHSFYPGTTSRGALLPFSVVQSRSRAWWGERGSRLRPAQVLAWEQRCSHGSGVLNLGGNELSQRAFALQESRAKLTCRGLLYGWDGLCSHQLIPVAISYSWVWEREQGDCHHRNAQESPP